MDMNSVDPVIQQIEQLLEDPGKSVLVSYVADFLSAAGVFIGVFDHSLGLRISTAPQSVLIGVSLLVVGAINIWRMVHKAKVAQAKVDALHVARSFPAPLPPA